MTEPDHTSRPDQANRDASLGVTRIGPSTNPDPERLALARRLAIEAARSLHDDKCEEVVILDLRGKSQMTDYFVIASGTSDRQMRSSGQHVSELAEELGIDLFRHNLRETGAKWIVLDFVDVVVHVFEPEERRFYDLEMLWGDADQVVWERDGEAEEQRRSRNRAGLRRDDVIPET